MTVDTSTVHIRSQSTLSHPLYTYTHTLAHTRGIMKSMCLPAFISMMAAELDLMILIFFYMQTINLAAHTFRFHLSCTLVVEVKSQWIYISISNTLTVYAIVLCNKNK